ncbi:MAG TPA: ATP-dependent zinc metalloprotease FtsH [Verrucomicrobiae bacterium]
MERGKWRFPGRGGDAEKRLPAGGPAGGTPPPFRFPIWNIIMMLILLWIWQDTVANLTVKTLPYSEFKKHVRNGEVLEAKVSAERIDGRILLKPGSTNAIAAMTNAPTKRDPDGDPNNFLFRTTRVEDPDLVKELEAAGVKFTGLRPSFLSQFLLAWILPIGIMILIWSFISRKISGGAQSLLSIGKNKARIVVDKNTGVTFADVAGCDEAKFELQEVVDFLKNPDRYKSLGAKIPKGVLLVGPPGTGKTLLARAVAGEAGVKFFSLSGSDFVEMFVGVGAARVRDLFEQAKASAPCIVFIDELDAIGRQRGVHMGPVNDEREQTLNQLLVEMDGFAANKGVILLAATNRPEILDRAILRPGRFDRQVIVDAPDIDGREAILGVHSKGKPLGADVNLRRLAQATPGFSGADLANTMNEAALLAARRKSDKIEQRDLEEAIEKVVAGPERKSRRLNEDEKRRVAYHEVGHALVAAESEGADPVHKISIVPRGRAALGYTMQLPNTQQFLATRTELLSRIRGLLGGRAAEEVVFGEVSTGAENDLERATGLARQMVCVFGMNERIGLSHVAHRQNGMLTGADAQLQRDSSEETAREIDEEVRKILDRSYIEAKQLLQARRNDLERVTVELLKRESLAGDEFYQMIGKSKPQHKPGEDIGPVSTPDGQLIDQTAN